MKTLQKLSFSELSRMMRQSGLQGSSNMMVTNGLGISTDSFFCKFFKRLTGQSPLRYRSR